MKSNTSCYMAIAASLDEEGPLSESFIFYKTQTKKRLKHSIEELNRKGRKVRRNKDNTENTRGGNIITSKHLSRKKKR